MKIKKQPMEKIAKAGADFRAESASLKRLPQAAQDAKMDELRDILLVRCFTNLEPPKGYRNYWLSKLKKDKVVEQILTSIQFDDILDVYWNI